MKSIWSKLLGLIKGNKLTTLVIAIILALLTIAYFQHQKILKLKEEKQTIEKLNSALNDSVTYYQNKRAEWVAEKLTIQETIKNLEKMYGQLSDAQKELIQRIKEINKKNDVITAALFEANVKIDSLLIKDKEDGSVVTVDTTKKMVNFNNLATKDTSFVFDIDVNHILPAHLDIKPTLLFKSIEIPNKQFVEFHWKNDRKKGYPISCSVTNTNKYIKITNLNSYAIPPLNKVKLDPNGWQKIGNFFIKNGRTLVYVGVGAAAGAGGYYLLTK